MADGTSIEWSDATWNPLVGCSRVSSGCTACYAERFVHRGLSPQHRGLTRATSRGPVWTGEVRLVKQALALPFRWRKPRRIFVNSLSDLFHESVKLEWIAAALGIMAATPHHDYLVLTKRAERMREVMTSLDVAAIREATLRVAGPMIGGDWTLPLPNVWLGVSCENQETADERIPLLLQTPAAVRWVSAEPLLGPIDFKRWIVATKTVHMRADVEGMLRHRSFDGLQHDDGRPMSRREAEDALYALHADGVAFIPASASACDSFDPKNGCQGHTNRPLDWIIVGGESGPGARPCDVSWIRSIVEQCRAASVPVFVKQIGSRPFLDAPALGGKVDLSRIRSFFKDRKGGDPTEWPPDVRVRELPAISTVRAAHAGG